MRACRKRSLRSAADIAFTLSPQNPTADQISKLKTPRKTTLTGMTVIASTVESQVGHAAERMVLWPEMLACTVKQQHRDAACCHPDEEPAKAHKKGKAPGVTKKTAAAAKTAAKTLAGTKAAANPGPAALRQRSSAPKAAAAETNSKAEPQVHYASPSYPMPKAAAAPISASAVRTSELAAAPRTAPSLLRKPLAAATQAGSNAAAVLPRPSTTAQVPIRLPEGKLLLVRHKSGLPVLRHSTSGLLWCSWCDAGPRAAAEVVTFHPERYTQKAHMHAELGYSNSLCFMEGQELISI